MVKRKRSSTPSRRTRRRTGKRRMRMTRRMPNVVPDSKIVKLRYVETVSRNPGTGATATYLFRANSLFDPNFTSTGHQPLGFDQWSIFYDHYTVIGSKITAQFLSTTSTPTTGAAVCGIRLADSVSTVADVTTAMEQGTSNYRIMTNANASGKVTLTKGFSAKKFFGLKDVKDNRGILGASMTTNPPEDAYFQVFVGPTELSQDLGDINIIVTIEYIAKLTERKTLVQS